jgi:uncharacterized protein (TIGR01777 family)
MEVTVLCRPGEHPPDLPEGTKSLEGDPTRPGPWQDEAARHDTFINLAGASIFSRWTKQQKALIRESRMATTRHLVDAVERRKGSPATLFSTSAVGYYGFTGDEELTEECPAGDDFLAGVAAEWEREAKKAEASGARVVITRFGIVLGPGGGALGQMIPLFRWGLGSPLGSGRQWFSWIHIDDLCRVFLFLMEHTEIAGPVNCTAPMPVTNRGLTRALAAALSRPVILPPVPAAVIRVVLGEFSQVLVRGQRVVPGRLMNAGFDFEHPDIEGAVRSALG